MKTTRIKITIKAPPERVYKALTDPLFIQQWRVPDGMHCHIHEFNAKEGGTFRISLTYDEPNYEGKTNSHTDTYHGYFKSLVPHEKVVEIMEFETSNPDMAGKMTSIVELKDLGGSTELSATHENLPSGLSEKDNEEGWRMSLEKLRRLVE
jgi:uncharacterized protein YndB with AHSA1/START domain